MASYRYLVIGGGMTGDAVCRGIRDHDPEGSIGLVAEEPHEPYARPPLSKALWKGKSEDSIWRGTRDLDVDLHLGRRVESLDVDSRTATDDAGETYEAEKVVLATGGTPRQLPSGEDIVYYRTVDDFRRLHDLAGDGVRVVVVGGGFIGSEIAAALTLNRCSVSMLFPEPSICARLFPEDLSSFVNGYYRERGVEVLEGEMVSEIAREGGVFRVATQSGKSVEGDAVVAGLGIVPRTDLAESSGLPVDDGILVNSLGQVEGYDAIFAAGDVARFPVSALGGSRRVEHEDHANTHGRSVGANMAGANVSYDHLPFFYSDLFDLGYEAVGDLDSRQPAVVEWAEPNEKGVVCYTDDAGKPKGFLLWDVWGKVDAARALIVGADPIDAGTLRGLID